MTDITITERVIAAVDKVHTLYTEAEPSVTITPATSLQVDLSFDSLDAVELVMELEEQFDIEISDEAMENFITVADVIKHIEAETARAAA